MQVDTELVYAYAITKDLGPLEEFITSSHLANLQAVGDRCAATRLLPTALSHCCHTRCMPTATATPHLYPIWFQVL